ncbi:cation diffusion facilitator CzcD-associated flavoprotein CzcO [Nocardia caishijiensis]|uniref:Cation diffusion facilitator CzcD-associated flavoprotein CzcO n=1 Tax=Nocardia caishijiensis TaxID=184756 RepID=A0ABQ6YS86_9NOCA|nr:cation diffusion facilitator CzcD-associated flavoprotein CzcO [Nocardia caishijiensis]
MSTIEHEIIIVGAGFSGIGAAIALREAGFEDFLLVDDADGVGGTWHWNTYPGVAVDIPSFSYQFSFDQRTEWSRVYAPGRELKAYAESCVDKYGLRPHIRFATTVVAADFDSDADRWVLRTAEGAELTARFVLSATGVLTRPKLPDIPGIETFAGTTVHTARWDHDLELRGKRVAVIGTGASAVQVIPEIAPQVEHLTVFQRTPIWCLPRPDLPLPAPARLALRLPGGRTLTRLISQTYVEVTFPLAAHYHRSLPTAAIGERTGLAHLRRQVKDPAVRAKLTPNYALGCKRPSFSNDYLATYNRANVTLETAPITEVTATGVRTSDTEHPADVLILATGFKVMESGNMPTYDLHGVDGLDLEKWWDENRLQAYEGVSVPGFPNYFSIMGPTATTAPRTSRSSRTRPATSCAACAGPATPAPPGWRSGARPTTGSSAKCSPGATARCSGRTAAPTRTATTSTSTAMCRCARRPRWKPPGAAAISTCPTTCSPPPPASWRTVRRRRRPRPRRYHAREYGYS